MMISPSENGGSKTALPGAVVRLLGLTERTVSRLEFKSLDQKEIEADVVTDDVVLQEPDIQLKEEIAEFDGRLKSQADQMMAQIEIARIDAKTEAREECEQKLEERVAEQRTLLVKALDEFQRERGRYFAGIETEIVKLSLAIAARVLHRESKLDPLLLTGVVRVALEKLAKESTAVLHVPVGELEMWRMAFESDMESSLQLMEDRRLSAGECVLNTNVGTVELGVGAQIEEIERGFFDLLQQRPA
jgi:flagellar assembly protein FliH